MEREVALKKEDCKLLEQFMISDAVVLDDQTCTARFVLYKSLLATSEE